MGTVYNLVTKKKNPDGTLPPYRPVALTCPTCPDNPYYTIALDKEGTLYGQCPVCANAVSFDKARSILEAEWVRIWGK